MRVVEKFRRTLIAATTLFCTVGCDSPAPSDHRMDAVPLKGTDAIRPEVQAQLFGKAEQGDWRAARELATYRWFVLDKHDPTTLKLVKLWAKHEPRGGRYMLALALSKSCALAQRREAIDVFEAYVADPSFPLQPPGKQQIDRDRLATMKSGVERTPVPCATY